MRYFGHQRPQRNRMTGEIVGSVLSPVKAKTHATLGHGYGPDWDKRLIVSLEASDVITLRPERTARPVSILAKDLYSLLLRKAANLAQLEKARARKAEREHKRRFK